VKIGSEEHKEFFCRHFVQTYTHYDPETLPWPDLDEAALQRIRSVPFWQEVFFTERRAGALVKAFNETVRDPVLKEAIGLQGEEEARHANLIRVMIRRYGIQAEELPLEPLPADIETAFKDFGFGECVDSFLGFGVFKIARQSDFLPESMFKIFDVLMYEETRHIVFFVNWMAYNQARNGVAARSLLPFVSFVYYLRAFKRMLGVAQRGAAKDDGKEFAVTQANLFLDGFTFRRFLEDCYSENRRRLSEFGPEMLRPNFLPQLAATALGALRLWSFKSGPRSAETTHSVHK
jgi:hypothetical protein